MLGIVASTESWSQKENWTNEFSYYYQGDEDEDGHAIRPPHGGAVAVPANDDLRRALWGKEAVAVN